LLKHTMRVRDGFFLIAGASPRYISEDDCGTILLVIRFGK